MPDGSEMTQPPMIGPIMVDLLQMLAEHLDDAFAAESGVLFVRLDYVRCVQIVQVQLRPEQRPQSASGNQPPPRWALAIFGPSPHQIVLIAKGRNAALTAARELAKASAPSAVLG